jgi:hypothetical protein
MNQENQQKIGNKNSNFFLVPHFPFDNKELRQNLTHAERDFLMVLCHLSNRYANADGWFWHTDRLFTTRKDKERGFESFGFSKSTCRRVRKKLSGLGLIEIKTGISERGRWPGKMYRLNPDLLKSTRVHSEAWSDFIENHGPSPP